MCAEAIVPISICTLCLDYSLKTSRNKEVIFVNKELVISPLVTAEALTSVVVHEE